MILSAMKDILVYNHCIQAKDRSTSNGNKEQNTCRSTWLVKNYFTAISNHYRHNYNDDWVYMLLFKLSIKSYDLKMTIVNFR